MQAIIETSSYLYRRAQFAQTFASAAACSACHAGLPQDRALSAVVEALTEPRHGIARHVAEDIAGKIVALVYAARCDSDFLPVMRSRAGAYAIRKSEYAAACAEAITL